MAQTVEVEIGLGLKDAETWSVELRASQLDEQDSEVRRAGMARAVDRDDLRANVADDSEYGRLLTERLFSTPEIRSAFRDARVIAAKNDLDLRVRLFVSPTAPELHDIRWETLRDPEDDSRLTTNERLAFSRYLSSLDWRPVAVRPKKQLRALAVIANPTDIETNWNLAAIDPVEHLERATHALAPTFETSALPSGQATQAELLAALREQTYDVVYIVCHGRLHKGQPYLLLERPDGRAQRLAGGVLAEELRQIRTLPRLVVLASCQSGGEGEGFWGDGNGALTALGPMLASAGIPAVVAMQGNVSIATASEFMPALFQELSKDGRIDRAMAGARSAVRDRPDWWAPVLFMRLKSGRVWYRPGLGTEGKEFDKWEAVVSDIGEQSCTPILGPGLTDSLMGTRQELAWRWAERFRFPMAPHGREDLPQVAQFLAARYNNRFVRQQLRETLLEELHERHRDRLTEEIRGLSLIPLLEKLGELQRAADRMDPHRFMASLPLPLYLTTHPTNLLADALIEAGRPPIVECFAWNDDEELPPSVSTKDPEYRPSVEQPFVFHLFGHLAYPGLLVVKEDDFFRYLINWNSRLNVVPTFVQKALTNTSLLFLGFRLDQWDFRVLFRTITSLEGIRRVKDFSHVGVQVAWEESQILDAEAARRYLDRYFRGEIDVNLYWGSVDDFVRQLHDHLGRA